MPSQIIVKDGWFSHSILPNGWEKLEIIGFANLLKLTSAINNNKLVISKNMECYSARKPYLIAHGQPLVAQSFKEMQIV